jgi:hypothetical protein
MKTILIFIVLFFALEIKSAETVQMVSVTEKVTRSDGTKGYEFWEVFELKMPEKDSMIYLQIHVDEVSLFEAKVFDGAFLITHCDIVRDFKKEQLVARIITTQSTGEKILQLKFKLGVLPIGSELRFNKF